MFLENIYLAGYAIAWITLTALYIIRTKGVGLGGMLLITYSLSALMSIVFFGGMGAFFNRRCRYQLATSIVPIFNY